MSVFLFIESDVKMEKRIKILQIDKEYNITYFIRLPGGLIHSPVTLQKAIQLLKTEKFDLIIMEPQNKAILTPQNEIDRINTGLVKARKETRGRATI